MCVVYRPCEFQLILNHQYSKLLKPLVAQRGKELQDLVTESNFVAQTHPENRIFVFAMKWLHVHKENSSWRPGDQVKPVQGHQMKFSSIPPVAPWLTFSCLGPCMCLHCGIMQFNSTWCLLWERHFKRGCWCHNPSGGEAGGEILAHV